MDELTRYIFNYHFHLMTPEERAAYKAVFAEEKAKGVENTKLAELLRNNFVPSDPGVQKLIVTGPDSFIEYVVERLLREERDKIFFNRCPKCQALARTPQAKQCPKCFHNWHEPT